MSYWEHYGLILATLVRKKVCPETAGRTWTVTRAHCGAEPLCGLPLRNPKPAFASSSRVPVAVVGNLQSGDPWLTHWCCLKRCRLNANLLAKVRFTMLLR
jgi:hypothetical protein